MAATPKDSTCTMTNRQSTNLPYKAQIYDQGHIGSCVCNASASAYACILQRQGHDGTFRPSRLFLYYLARLADLKNDEKNNRDRKGKSGWFASMALDPPKEEVDNDNGSMGRDVLKAISALGCCPKAESISILKHESNGTWPLIDVQPPKDTAGDVGMPPYMQTLNKFASWDESKNKKWPIFPGGGAFCRLPPDPKCFANAKNHRTLRYARSEPNDDVNCWKTLIQARYPVFFGIRLYNNFNKTAKNPDEPWAYTAAIPDPEYDGKDFAAHAVLAVG